MEVLYVVRFEAKAKNGNLRAFEILEEHASRWIRENTGAASELVNLGSDGSFTRWNDGAAQWATLRCDESRAVRITVRQQSSHDSVFESRTTLAEINGETSLRVSLARESTSPGLTPLGPPEIKQPTLIQKIASDDSLVLSAEGARQDGAYLLIRNDDEARELVNSIQNSRRIPILILHPQNRVAWQTAKTIAMRLIGLVRVVVAGYRYTRALQPAGINVPFGGAALIWSNPSHEPMLFTEEELDGLGQEGVRRTLISELAELSVRARGKDSSWALVRQASLAESIEQASIEASKAVSMGDLAAESTALRAQVVSLRQQSTDAEDMAAAYASDAERFRSELEALAREKSSLKAKADNLEAQLRAQNGGVENEALTLESTPPLTRSNPSPTFRHIEKSSAGRLTFTDNAATSWVKSTIESTDRVHQDLIGLARLAVHMYDPANQPLDIVGRMDDWIEQNFEISVAMKDRRLVGVKFPFEGKEWDISSHIKVTDHTAWSKVARVHFALDPDGGRIIVDHVGNKLYK